MEDLKARKELAERGFPEDSTMYPWGSKISTTQDSELETSQDSEFWQEFTRVEELQRKVAPNSTAGFLE